MVPQVIVTRGEETVGERFSIEVDGAGLTEGLPALFTQAVDRWSRFIDGPVRDFEVDGETISGLRIVASVGAIDGAQGLAAETNFKQQYFRPNDGGPLAGLPAKATITIDEANLAAYQAGEALTPEKKQFLLDLITHEIGHALGFTEGVWLSKGWLNNPGGTVDPTFTGPSASEAYGKVLNIGMPTPVPVEGLGLDDPFISHWLQAVFHSELMTYRIEPGKQNPIGPVTVAALEDLGYAVSKAVPETNKLDLLGSPADITAPDTRIAAARTGGAVAVASSESASLGEDAAGVPRLRSIFVDCRVTMYG